jgi:hypothetical protein
MMCMSNMNGDRRATTALTHTAVNIPALITEDERLLLPWPERAKSLQIVDARTLQIADEERSGAKDLLAALEAKHERTCKDAYTAWQSATAHRKSDTDPLKEAIATYDRGMKSFDAAEKQRAREEQRRIEQAAYQKQLEEREAVVEHVEATGGTANEVKSVIERAVPIPVAPHAVMETAQAPVQAVNSRVLPNWKGEITDMWAFCEYAVKNNRRELIALLTGDKVAILRIAGSTKGAMEVPGLRIWDEGKVASLPKKAGV